MEYEFIKNNKESKDVHNMKYEIQQTMLNNNTGYYTMSGLLKIFKIDVMSMNLLLNIMRNDKSIKRTWININNEMITIYNSDEIIKYNKYYKNNMEE